jgi:hypothetical protein
VVVDLNRDGCDDIVFGVRDNSCHGWFKALISDGTGRFTLTTGPRLDNCVYNLTVGDFNGDGKADIAGYGQAVGTLEESLFVHLGDGAGGLGAGISYTIGKAVGSLNKVTTGDLNGDGKPDIVESHMHQWSSPDHVNEVTVLLNTTSGNSAPLIAPPFVAGGLVGQSFSYSIRASGTAPITFTANPLPAGLSRSGNVISGTPTQVGQTLVTLTAANAVGSDTNVLTVMITDPANRPPQITAGPTATPNRAGVSKPVAFSVTATDADGDSLSYYWVFGDGSTSSPQAGGTATHTYATNGEFVVSVRVTDGKGGSATAGVKVTVSDEKPGDLNGDGVVNVDDVTLVTAHYGQTSANPNWDGRADANNDGVVDDADLALVKANFGRKYQ